MLRSVTEALSRLLPFGIWCTCCQYVGAQNVPTDIGTLFPDQTTSDSSAVAINGSRQIVGSSDNRGILYGAGVLTDLSISNPDAGKPIQAWGINSKGLVV